MEFCSGLSADELVRKLPVEQIRHSMNVELLVGKLAGWLPVSKTDANADQYRYFGKAAYYHDIGKVCIPLNILNKPGALTPEEYRMIQKHPIFAQELFAFGNAEAMRSVSKHLLFLALNAATYHHEWWNGKGYPFGLSHLEIPYIARVTSVCDAYDAMVSERSYRQVYTHERACEELAKGSGTQFDPSILKIFLKHEAEIGGLFKNPCIRGKWTERQGSAIFI